MAYLVIWQIDSEAENPTEAAMEALIAQRDPASVATVFTVRDKETGAETQVDLGDVQLPAFGGQDVVAS